MAIDPNIAAAGIQAGTSLLGGLFGGGGGSKSPYSYGYDGGSSFQQSGSSGSSFSYQAPDQVWAPQGEALQGLYGSAQNVLAGGGNQAAANQLFQQGMTGVETLLNPQMNPLMQVYQDQLQQGLEQNILPSIRRDALGSGQLGGGRQGVAEGIAAQEAMRMQSDFAAQLYDGDMNRMLGAVNQIPGLTNTGLGVPWHGVNQLSGILGSPTVLDQGGVSGSQNSSFGVGGSESFGENFGGPKRYWEDDTPAVSPSFSEATNTSGRGSYQDRISGR